jgi:hypothetical protein
MEQLLAITVLTLKEASRKKVFAVLIIFALALISCSALFPAIEPTSRICLAKVWTLRAISVFSALAAIFLVGISIPLDIEEKRVYTLFSKPLHKALYFMGKFLGFAIIVGLFVLLTGVISMLYVRLTAIGIGQAEQLGSRSRVFTHHLKGKNYHTRTVDGTKEYGLLIPENRYLLWEFRDLKPSKFEEEARCGISLSINDKESFAHAGTLKLTFINPQTRESYKTQCDVRSQIRHSLRFPRRIISSDGRLQVQLERVKPQTVVIATANSVFLEEGAGSFELNYLKGLGLIFLQSLVVTSGTLCVTSFVSGPVGIFFGLALLFCGSIYGFVEESIRLSEKGLKRRQELLKQGKRVYSQPQEIPPWLLDIATRLSKNALKVIPDFRRFDPSDKLLENLVIPGQTVASSLIYSTPYLIFFVLLGAIIMHFKGFG